MKICVDENIPNVTVQELRLLGHDVLDIRGTADQGMDDDILWARVQAEQRLLITTDKGFVWRRDELHWGILVVRLRQPNEQKIHQRVMQALNRFSEQEWLGLGSRNEGRRSKRLETLPARRAPTGLAGDRLGAYGRSHFSGQSSKLATSASSTSSV